MTRSHFRDDHTAIVPGRATAYAPTGKGGFRIDMSNWNQLGDGQVQTSVTELVRWEENFSTAKVGGRLLIDRMQERGTLDTGASTSYGRGLFVDTYRGVPRVHHSGSWAGYRSLLMRFPEQRLSIAMLCNRADMNPKLAENVADLVLGGAFQAAEKQEGKAPAPLSPVASAPVSGDLGRYVGLYYDGVAKSVLHVRQQNGKLELGLRGRNLPIRVVGAERLEVEGTPLALTFAGEQFTLLRREEPLGDFKRMQPTTPSDDDWKRLVGTYYSPELETTWRIELKDGKAVLKGRALGTQPLEPAFVDGFSTGRGFLRLTRDDAGRLTGFLFGELQFERK